MGRVYILFTKLSYLLPENTVMSMKLRALAIRKFSMRQKSRDSHALMLVGWQRVPSSPRGGLTHKQDLIISFQKNKKNIPLVHVSKLPSRCSTKNLPIYLLPMCFVDEVFSY